MSKTGDSIKPKKAILPLVILVVGIIGYLLFYNYTYSSLKIKTDKVNVIEYGTEKYNLKKFIKNADN